MSERHVTFDMILASVGALTGLTRLDLLSDRREAGSGQARNTVYWLARQLLPVSYPVIGRLAGGKDHASIMAGVKRAEAERDVDPEYRTITDALLGALRAIERAGVIRVASLADPLATARRVLANPLREAVRVPVVEIVAMAQLVVETFGEDDAPTPEPAEPASTATQEIDHAA